jgi:hypothetical protein
MDRFETSADNFWAIKSITIGKMIINKFWGYLPFGKST